MRTMISRDAVPRIHAERDAWLLFQLRLRGWTLSKIAKRHSVDRNTIRKALIAPYPKSEKRIATRLGLRPRDIWPERFDERGERRRKTPGRKPRAVTEGNA